MNPHTNTYRQLMGWCQLKMAEDSLRRVGDRLFREFVLPGGDTGFWGGVGIGNDEVILYLDESQARRVVEVPSEVDGVKVRVIKARRPRAL